MSEQTERRLAFDDPAATWAREPIAVSHHDGRMTVEAAGARLRATLHDGHETPEGTDLHVD
ncbi:MAG: hypothetical protein ACXIUP_02565 [Microcella sp.]